MAKKRTKAQKKTAKNRTIQPVVSSTINSEIIKKIEKKDFLNQEKGFIISDLKKTSLFTIIIIAVLLIIFVYTKTS